MCIDVDDDGSVLLSSGERRARKAHRCNECGREIKAGERYQHWVFVGSEFYDGLTTMKMCAHCWATIEVGAKISDCPKSWYWEKVFDLEADDGGFLGDVMLNHPLTRRQRAWCRLMSYRGRHRWYRDDGSLYPVPVLEAA